MLDNRVLTSLSGLRNVSDIGELLFLQGNTALTDIGLTSLRTIGGDRDRARGGLVIEDQC